MTTTHQAQPTPQPTHQAPGTTDATPTTPAPTDRPALATLQPSPAQIRAARMLAEQTQDQAALLVHVTGRAWRRWESGERQISGAAWELYLIKALGFAPIK